MTVEYVCFGCMDSTATPDGWSSAPSPWHESGAAHYCATCTARARANGHTDLEDMGGGGDVVAIAHPWPQLDLFGGES